MTSFKEINEHDETTKKRNGMTNAGCLAGVFSESGGTHRRLQR